MPNDRWAPELNEDDLRRAREKGPGAITRVRPRADPYDLWKEGGSMVAGFVFWLLTGVVGFGLGFAIGYGAWKVFG